MQCATYFSGSALDVPRVHERLLSFGFVPPSSHVYTEPTPSVMANSLVQYLLKYAAVVADDMVHETHTATTVEGKHRGSGGSSVSSLSSSRSGGGAAQPRLAVCGIGRDERVAGCFFLSPDSVLVQLLRALLEGGGADARVGIRMHRMNPATSTLAGGGAFVSLSTPSATTISAEEAAESAALAAVGMQKETAFTTFSSVDQCKTRISAAVGDNETVDSFLVEVLLPVPLVKDALTRVENQRRKNHSQDTPSSAAKNADASAQNELTANTPDTIRLVMFALANEKHLSEFVGPLMSLVADEFAATVLLADSDSDVVFCGNYAAQIMSKSGFAAREGRKALRKDPILFTEATRVEEGKKRESGSAPPGRLRIGSGLPRSGKPQSLSQVSKAAHPYDLPSAGLARGMKRFSSTPDRHYTQSTRSVSEITATESVLSSITASTSRIDNGMDESEENRSSTPPPLPAPLADVGSPSNRPNAFRSLPQVYELSPTRVQAKNDEVSPIHHPAAGAAASSSPDAKRVDKNFAAPILAQYDASADMAACTSEEEYLELFQRLNDDLKAAQQRVSALRHESSRRMVADHDEMSQVELALQQQEHAAGAEAQRARNTTETLESRRTSLEEKRTALRERIRASKNAEAAKLNAASREKAADRQRALLVELDKLSDEKSFLSKECEKWRAHLATAEKKRAASVIAGYARGPARKVHATPVVREEDVDSWRRKAVMEFVRCESAKRASIMCNEMGIWEHMCLVFQTTSYERRRIMEMIRSSPARRPPPHHPTQNSVPDVSRQPERRDYPVVQTSPTDSRAHHNTKTEAPRQASRPTPPVSMTSSQLDQAIPRRLVTTPHITASATHQPKNMYAGEKSNGTRALATVTHPKEIMAMNIRQVENVVQEASLRYELDEAMQLYEEANAEQRALVEMLDSAEHNAAYLQDVEDQNELTALLQEQATVQGHIKQLRKAGRAHHRDYDDDDDDTSSSSSDGDYDDGSYGTLGGALQGFSHRFEDVLYESDALIDALRSRVAQEVSNTAKRERQRRRDLKKQLKSTEMELEHAMRSYRDELTHIDDQRAIQRRLVEKIKLYEA